MKNIILPGNSAIVTFLGWWVHVTRDPSKWLSDLQRLGIKRSRLESPGCYNAQRIFNALIFSTPNTTAAHQSENDSSNSRSTRRDFRVSRSQMKETNTTYTYSKLTWQWNFSTFFIGGTSSNQMYFHCHVNFSVFFSTNWWHRASLFPRKDHEAPVFARSKGGFCQQKMGFEPGPWVKKSPQKIHKHPIGIRMWTSECTTGKKKRHVWHFRKSTSRFQSDLDLPRSFSSLPSPQSQANQPTPSNIHPSEIRV